MFHTFSESWINKNFVTDGVSLKLKGQQYLDSKQSVPDNLFNYIDKTIGDETLTFSESSIYGFLNNPIGLAILNDISNNFPAQTNLLTSLSSLTDFSNSIKAKLNSLEKTDSSDRVVTCDMLYRRDALQDIVLNILTNPRNRLSIGPPTLLPLEFSPTGILVTDAFNPEGWSKLALNSSGRYDLPEVSPLSTIVPPTGMQQGSIFNVSNSGSSIFNHGNIILPNRDTVLGTIQLPPGMYNILANIPVDILPGTTISNYVAVITSSGVSGSNTITSLATEVNNTGSTIRKYIQQTKNVTLTNNTMYNIIVKFNYSEGEIKVASNSSSGFKFEAVKIA